MNKEYYHKLHNLLKQTAYNSKKSKAEDAYRELCSRFSPAYLSGCSWYKGPTLDSGKLFDPDIYHLLIYQDFFKNIV